MAIRNEHQLFDDIKALIRGNDPFPAMATWGLDLVPTVSQLELLALNLLRGNPGCYAFDLVHSSYGRLKSGTVYVMLSRMEGKGLVRHEGETERRRYFATELGERLRRAVMISQFAMVNALEASDPTE